MENALSLALKLIGIIVDLWPAFGDFLGSVSEHPDYRDTGVAILVRQILPEKSASEEAAETLRGA